MFPLLNGVFKSPLWDTESRLSNSGNFGIGSSPGSLLRLPFRLTFDSMRFGESSPSGSAGVALLLAFPFSVGLLLADKLGHDARKGAGCALLAVGALSSIPLVMNVVGKPQIAEHA